MLYFSLLQLELKNFLRNPQLGTNLLIKGLSYFGMIMMSAVFILLAFFMYFYPKEELNIDPIIFLYKYLIYYIIIDLILRYFIQQMPTQNIKPFLTIGIKKKTLVNYTILKILFNFFNWGNLLFLIPFTTLVCINQPELTFNSIIFTINLLLIFYINNFINILINGKTSILIVIISFLTISLALNYFDIVSLSQFSEKLFYYIFQQPLTILIILSILLILLYSAYQLIKNIFYLDKGLEKKEKAVFTNDIKFLKNYGILGTFINNDIRLISRNKAAKSALFTSLLFLGYGLLYNLDMYQSATMQLFIGIFVTGNFMLIFGQKVPSWDSSYYPLMMTQNVPYITYLKAKWSLIVGSIILSTIISSLYIYISKELYLTIIAAGIYNIGVNSYIVLLNGAFNKTAIDLNSSAKSFGGGSNNFNLKTILLVIPQMLLPMIVYGLIYHFFNIYMAMVSIAILGIIGLLFRDKVFLYIVKYYKKEKYSTIQSFKNI